MELHGKYNTHSLPSFPALLWPEVVTPDIIISMGQIELNSVLMLN